MNGDRSLELVDSLPKRLDVTIGLLGCGAACRETQAYLSVRNLAEVLQQPSSVRNADIVPVAKTPLDSAFIYAFDETFSLVGKFLAVPFAARERIAEFTE